MTVSDVASPFTTFVRTERHACMSSTKHPLCHTSGMEVWNPHSDTDFPCLMSHRICRLQCMPVVLTSSFTSPSTVVHTAVMLRLPSCFSLQCFQEMQ